MLGRGDPLSVLWHFFASDEVHLALTALLVVVLAVGSFLPAFGEGPGERDVSERLAWPMPLRALASPFDSFAFGALWALFLFSLLIKEAEDWRLLGEAVRAGWPAWPGLRAGWRKTWGWLRRLLGQRGVLRKVGESLIRLGLVVMALGAVFNGRWAWREEGIVLAPGEVYRLQRLSGHFLKLEGVEIGPGQREGPPLVRARVVLGRDGEARRAVVDFGHPARNPGFSVYQVSYGPALGIRARDEEGHSLLLQPLVPGAEAVEEAFLAFPEPRYERYLLVPARKVVLRLVFHPSLTERGFSGPVFLVQAYRGTEVEPLLSEFFPEEGIFRLEGDVYELRPTSYPVFDIVWEPGWFWTVAGATLALMGSALAGLLLWRGGWA